MATKKTDEKDGNGKTETFTTFNSEERRKWALKITEQAITNRRLAAKLKLGKERMEKLCTEFEKGGYFADSQEELPMDGGEDEQGERASA